MTKRKRNNLNIISASKKTKETFKDKSDLRDEEPWSKSKKKRMRALLAKQKKNNEKSNDGNLSTNTNSRSSSNNDNASSSLIKKQKELNCNIEKNEDEDVTDGGMSSSISLNLGPQSISNKPKSALQQQFLSRLAGSRFRELNEELYTTNSASAFKSFQENPELFDQYHEGFRTQVKSWPVNPVDLIYRWIVSLYKGREQGLKDKQLTVADFGCGDAKLAEKLLAYRSNSKKGKKNKNHDETSPFKVHSFDLVQNGNELITPCDMSNVPLKDGIVDVGTFVLALMGTNIADFIREAHRVLTPDGVLKIAEVRSRFESTVDEGAATNNENDKKGSKKQAKNNFKYSKKQSDDTLLNEFIDVMKELGFICTKKDRQNKMFLVLEFEKSGMSPSKQATFTAKACIYKRR